VLHNKLDLITHEESLANLAKVREFLDGSPAQDLKILPISAQTGENVDQVLKYLAEAQPRRMENINDPAELVIIRSFNINKPNMKINDMKGGVIGGSLKSGHLKVGDYLQIQPGVIEGNRETGWTVRPLLARVTSLFSERRSLDVAIPGGLLGIGTSLDAGLTKNNKLVGQMATHIGHGPPIIEAMTIKYKSMMRMDGIDTDGKPKMKKSESPGDGEIVRVCVHATSVEGTIQKLGKKKEMRIILHSPVSCSKSDNVVIMCQRGGRWTISGTGSALLVEPVERVIYPMNHDSLKTEFETKRLASPITLVNDLMNDPQPQSSSSPSPIPEYDTLLTNIQSRAHDTTSVKMGIVAPKLRPHNRVTIWDNFMNVMESISAGYDADESAIPAKHVIDVQKHFLKFLSEEMATTHSINGEKQLIINGKFRDGHAEKVLRNYLKQFRTCVNCGKMDSFLYKRQNMTVCYCNHCNSERTISKMM